MKTWQILLFVVCCIISWIVLFNQPQDEPIESRIAHLEQRILRLERRACLSEDDSIEDVMLSIR